MRRPWAVSRPCNLQTGDMHRGPVPCEWRCQRGGLSSGFRGGRFSCGPDMRKVLAVSVALVFMLAGCGEDSGDDDAAPTARVRHESWSRRCQRSPNCSRSMRTATRTTSLDVRAATLPRLCSSTRGCHVPATNQGWTVVPPLRSGHRRGCAGAFGLHTERAVRQQHPRQRMEHGSRQLAPSRGPGLATARSQAGQSGVGPPARAEGGDLVSSASSRWRILLRISSRL